MGARQKVPMSQASLHIVPLSEPGEAASAQASHSMLFHALIQQEALPVKRERVKKPKALRNPAVGRPSAICFSASLISFTEHPLGNTGLVYGFTEAESWAGSIVSVLFSFLLHSVPFSAMNFIKVDSEPQA